MFCSNSFAHALPVSYTIFPLLSSSAGGLALPGNAKPIASEMEAIVFAVNIPPQEPALGQAVFSIFLRSSSEIFPASYWPTASYTSTTVSSRPSSIPGIIVPP